MKRMLCALALTILLTGCALQRELPEDSAAPAGEEILLVIDGREVPAWRYLCWLDRAVAQGLEGEAAREQALGDTALYAAVESLAEEWAVTLTAEEEDALTPGVWAGLKEEQWRELSAVGALYAKLCEREVPQETLEAFGKERGYRTVDRILIPAGEGADKQAAEVFARLNGGGEEAFHAAKSLSADRLGPRTFCPGDGTLAPELEEAAAALSEGQLSGILESEEGFSILYCLPLDIEQMRIPWLDEQLRTRVGEADIQVLSGYENLGISAGFPSNENKIQDYAQQASSS